MPSPTPQPKPIEQVGNVFSGLAGVSILSGSIWMMFTGAFWQGLFCALSTTVFLPIQTNKDDKSITQVKWGYTIIATGFIGFHAFYKLDLIPTQTQATTPTQPSNLQPKVNPNLNFVTKDTGFASLSEANLTKAETFISQGDKQAFSQMVNDGRIILLKGNVPVFGQYACSGILCDRIRIRPEGSTIELWTNSTSVSHR